MKNKPLVISTVSLIVAISLSAAAKTNSNKTSAEQSAQAEYEQTFSPNLTTENKEMRAVWVPFMSLNMKNTDFSEHAFKEKFDSIIADSLKNNLNTLVVQVRAFSDSMYQSKYFPWSHLLTGEQGKNPGFDPLEYMINAAHKAGLQFHAWVNPFRIQINNTPDSLCESNVFYSLKNIPNSEDIIFETTNGKYLNPAYPNVRELIINGIKEIIEKYPVDGIQFDDYFYPEDEPEIDKISYENYCNLSGNIQPLPLKKWRAANINSLVSGTYSAIKSINSNIVFGISPSGNLNNNEKICADVATWCKTPGYIDYICPQIYFSLEHPLLPSATATSQWKNIVKSDKIKLYFGLAAYKAGSDTADFGTWKNHEDILKTQIEQCRDLGCNGFMFFSSEDFKNKNAELELQNAKSVLS